MYHTLVPQSERKALRREYRLRALVVLCFGLSICGLIGIVSLLPAFLSATIEERSAQNDLQSIKKAKDMSGLTQIQQKVASSQGLLGILEEGTRLPRLSAVIEEIVGERGMIRITSMSVSEVSTTTVTTALRGVAPTRDSLLAFKSRLLAGRPGSKVDLPVSELAKSADIEFSIKVTQKFP